jgi:signal transduction histidine kinase
VAQRDRGTGRLGSFRPQFEEARIAASLEGPPSAAAHADPERLVRVVYNLLHNALRHTPHDGAIVVRAEPLDDGRLRIAISNTGEGIPPADVPFVFDRFFRGDRARTRDGAGSGLGLSIARGIVEGHGGRIWIESVAAPGTTTIAFTLPSNPVPAAV